MWRLYTNRGIKMTENKTEAVNQNFATEKRIKIVCQNLADMLISKNRKYGDSALSPIKVFSKSDNTMSLLVRADDKLSRIRNSDKLDQDDVFDLMGYCVLIAIAHGWTEYEIGTEKLTDNT